MSGPDQGLPCRCVPCANDPSLETLHNICYCPEENKARAGVVGTEKKKKYGFTSSFKEVYFSTTAVVIADDTYELDGQGQD